MESATQILRHEHDAILRMLEVTEVVASRLAAGQSVEPQVLADLLEFFRTFADRCHHGKEEDLLFPLLESRGLPRAGGPIGVMLHEHEHGRAFVRQMAEAAEAYAREPQRAGPAWAEAARNYAALLRQHIDKENNVLFVIAENLLAPEDQQRLAAEFNRGEEKLGAGTHERLHRMMEQLSQQVRAR